MEDTWLTGHTVVVIGITSVVVTMDADLAGQLTIDAGHDVMV